MSRELAAASAAVGETSHERGARDEYCSAIDHEQNSAVDDSDSDADGKITKDLFILNWSILTTLVGPAHVAEWTAHLAAMCSRS